MARKARKGRKGQVMARASRKKANIRTRHRIQARTLFVGIAVRKATRAQNVGRIPRINLALLERKTMEAEKKTKNVTGKGAGSLEQGEQAAVAEPQPQPALASSLDLASVEAHMTWARRFRHFRWMQELARKRWSVFPRKEGRRSQNSDQCEQNSQ